MAHTHKVAPEPQAILRVWPPFKEAIGVTSVRTEEDYAQARITIEALLDEIGDDENLMFSTTLPIKWRPMRMSITRFPRLSQRKCYAS